MDGRKGIASGGGEADVSGHYDARDLPSMYQCVNVARKYRTYSATYPLEHFYAHVWMRGEGRMFMKEAGTDPAKQPFPTSLSSGAKSCRFESV